MNDCVFCKIVKDEIPSNKVYEDAGFLAFLTTEPANFGHILVIPKEHYKNLSETPKEVAGNLMSLVPELSAAVLRAMNAPAFNVIVNTGKEAAQMIFHTHLHIIPRFEGDGHQKWDKKDYESPEHPQQIADKIRAEL